MHQNIKSLFIMLITLASLTFSAQAETLKSGKWTKKEHNIEGSWKITEDNGVMKLTLTNLKTKKAPDLKIFFSSKSIGNVTAKTATKNSVYFKKLTSHKGTQTYTLPKDFDLSKYKSILIHCQKYTKLWGGANL